MRAAATRLADDDLRALRDALPALSQLVAQLDSDRP
jgi:hypothetical protein